MARKEAKVPEKSEEARKKSERERFLREHKVPVPGPLSPFTDEQIEEIKGDRENSEER